MGEFGRVLDLAHERERVPLLWLLSGGAGEAQTRGEEGKEKAADHKASPGFEASSPIEGLVIFVGSAREGPFAGAWPARAGEAS